MSFAATVRPVRPEDVPAVVAMVHELAAYERAADRCRLTRDQPEHAAIGAEAVAGWVPYRLSGAPLRRLAERASPRDHVNR